MIVNVVTPNWLVMPGGERQARVSSVGPMMISTAVSPASSPAVMVPVRVTTSLPPALVTVRLSVNVLVWPVFQVMMRVAVPGPARLRQDRVSWTVTPLCPAVRAGWLAATHGA